MNSTITRIETGVHSQGESGVQNEGAQLTRSKEQTVRL